MTEPAAKRGEHILAVFDTAFGGLLAADPEREARGGPHLDERTSRVWIHGDLHAENFGTYMNANGRLIFNVNDFDEAYVRS
ncbi:DUF2252 family protein, partial [Streptomyces sp. bgisy082]|uniref:DUF2252 family protein n=1 Tax=Streptomyces sp. bgisy082 TaxID=3413776 RepID=UPI003D73F1E5